MKNIRILKMLAVFALSAWVVNADAATAQFMATATVTSTCAADVPSSIPAGVSANRAGSYANVNCSSGAAFLVVSDPAAGAVGNPASGVAVTDGAPGNAFITVTY